MLPAASEHYAAMLRLVAGTVALTRSAWRRMDMDDLDGSFAVLAPTLTAILSRAQVQAAHDASTYVPKSLSQNGITVDAAGAVNAAAWGLTAPDGRSLPGLLVGAKIAAKEAQSLDAGQEWLDMATQTTVEDANRSAAGVAIAARPRVGYVRMVNPGCCQRCAVLAGRFYRYNSGFLRHPRCHCQNVPTTEAASDGLVDKIHPDQIRDLTEAQRKAIRDGADMNRVINAHRKGRGGMTTTVGYRGQKSGARLTPEGIYRLASSRDEAIQMLRRYGYLI